MKKLLLYTVAALCYSFSIAQVATTCDTIEFEIQGKITYASSSTIKMNVLSGFEMPVIKQRGELSKQFNTELFGGKVSGWLAIGELEVVSFSGNTLSFRLLKELSVITENGVKKNHFEIGKEVKFVWKVCVSKDEAAYQKGQAVVEKDPDKALEYYRQAITINPSHDKAANMIGMIWSQKEQKDSSLVYFKRAFEINPGSNQYAKNISITVYATGKLDEGYAYANKAVENDNHDAEAWYLKGLMLYLIKKDSITAEQKAQVLDDLGKAITLDPTNPFYYSERALLRSGFGNKSGACEDARKAKQLGAVNGNDLIKSYCSE